MRFTFENPDDELDPIHLSNRDIECIARCENRWPVETECADWLCVLHDDSTENYRWWVCFAFIQTYVK